MDHEQIVDPSHLAFAIQQRLELYSDSVTEKVNASAKTSAFKLLKLTKATAPKKSGFFRKHLAVKEDSTVHGMKSYLWYVKDPAYRLTHLLVHGHANRDGSRTEGDPFLKDALDEVLPEFEQAVKEAIKNS